MPIHMVRKTHYRDSFLIFNFCPCTLYTLLLTMCTKRTKTAIKVTWSTLFPETSIKTGGNRSSMFCLFFFSFFFLALLCATAQQSYCHDVGVCRPSVRRHPFLGNRQVDWHQILLTGTYPPYLQTIFLFLFSKILNFWVFTIYFRFL